MSVNIIDMAKGYLTKGVVSKAASFVGESESATQSGFDHILPALMGGILAKGSEKSGAQAIFDLVSKPELSGGLLNNVSDLFSGTDTSNDAMTVGGDMLRSAMGDRLGSVTDLISSASGMKSGSTSSLMKLALPMLMSVIGKKVKSDGLGLDGFVNLMSGQREFVEKAAPSGFWDGLLGVFGVGGLGGAAAAAITGVADTVSNTASNVASSVSDAAENTSKKITSTVNKATGNANNNNKGGGGFFSRLMPIILVVALIALAFWLYRSCKDDIKNTGQKVVDTTTGAVDEAGDAIKDGAGKVGNVLDLSKNEIYKFLGADRPTGTYDEATDRFVYEAGEMVDIKLPNDKTINVGQYSGENFLYQLINQPNYKVDEDPAKGWFTLDGVFFNTGSASLDESSLERLDDIAEILTAYPNVNLKIGGYTDNVGDANANLKLSDSRAKSALNHLVSKGIAASRLKSEGFGDQFPICPANDNASCKAQNRRVDIRITQK